jgi:hypothetical protein
MRKKKLARLSGGALPLLGVLLTACATPPATTLTPKWPVQAQSGAQSAVRAILYFHHAPADSPQLLAAISEACHCRPVFFRAYGNDALIYEIALTQGQDFAALEKALLQSSRKLGIRAVEQDQLRQSQ